MPLAHRTLIIKLGSLGDILQSSPVISAISDHYKGKIDVVTFSGHGELFENHPHVSQVWEIPRRGWSRFIRLYRLRQQRYDLIFNLHRSIWLDILAWFVGAKDRVGFSSPEKTTLFLTAWAAFDLEISRHKRYLSLVQLAVKSVISLHKYPPVFFPGPQLNQGLVVNSASHIVIAPFGGKNVDATMRSRRWPYYSQLMTKILDLSPSCHISLVGGGEDVSDLLALRAPFSNNVQVVTPTINELAYLLKSTALFIGNDSFPLAMAVTQGCPVIGIFGPTDSKKIIQETALVSTIQGHAVCAPCYNPLEGHKNIAYHCPYEYRCIRQVSVEMVLNECKKKAPFLA
ncbi:MAG: glycosyltransferase family 9 protein [Candidatus Marinamargulisbacteria bacterium]